MKRFAKSISVLAASSMLALAACGDDPTGVNSGDQLTEAEIQALLNHVGEAIGGVSPSASMVGTPEGIQLVDIDQSVSVTAPCQAGEVSVSGSVEGTVDDVTYDSDLLMKVTLDYDGCVIPTEETTFTVDGAPDIYFEADFMLRETEFSVSGLQRGGFRFTASDGREGSCAIDLRFDASYTSGASSSVTSSVTGTICSRSASAFEAYSGF
jgi:hypothetical protein